QAADGKSLIRQFNYTPQSHLGRIFPYLPLFLAEELRLRYEHIDMTKVKFPKSGTHLKLRYGVLDMDFTTMSYKSYAAPPVLIDKHFEVGPLDLTLDDNPVIENMVIPILGIRLYQGVGDAIVPLNDEKFVSLSVMCS